MERDCKQQKKKIFKWSEKWTRYNAIFYKRKELAAQIQDGTARLCGISVK